MNKKLRLREFAKSYSSSGNAEQLRENVLRDVFASRGEPNHAELDYSLKALIPPKDLFGIEAAVSLLVDAVQHRKKIVIVGDFDADGATSTAVAIRCLKALGHDQVDFLVPNRFVYGYGLTPGIVDSAAEIRPDLLLTVDNGISSVEGVLRAKSLGIPVLITDHHLPGSDTPPADAIVNPNQLGCSFSSKHLAGVGVIFYLMLALRASLRDLHWFGQKLPEPNFACVLDLVALGTVADVVSLDLNNRILVRHGLDRIKRGSACAGIRALLQVSGRVPEKVRASDLGFLLGPRVNAAGRLDDMSTGIRCLISDDYAEALELAAELDSLNRERKNIEQGMQREAEVALANLEQDETQIPNGICLFEKNWHQGVIGILASRIKDRWHRPTIVFAETGERELKGSGRSISGIHLRDVLDEMAKRSPGLLEKFGGHAMAAGMSIHPDKLDDFSKLFDEVVGRYLTEELASPVIFSDGELPSVILDNALAEKIQLHGPWGQNFAEPAFHGCFRVVQQRIVGQKHLKLVLALDTDSSTVLDAIAFNVDVEQWPDNTADKVSCVYQLDINEYRGQRSLQLLIRSIDKN